MTELKKKRGRPKKVVQPAAPAVSVDLYTATAKIGARVYQSTGASIGEAINNLQATGSKGRSILTIQKGDLKKERILMPITTYRLFNSGGLTKEVAIKNVTLLFGI